MSKLFAMTIPVTSGKEKMFDDFIADLNGKYKSAFTESRRRLKVRERTFRQVSPNGVAVVVTLEGDDPSSAFQQFASGNDEFTKWFVGKVKEIHGLDLSAPPPGPMPEMLIDTGA